MGSQSVKAITSLSERKDYLVHLLNDVKALEYMIENDHFEKDIQRIGAEQELCLIDKKFRPSKKALEVLDQIDDEHFTTELALFNLEINLDPIELKTKCFSILENQLSSLLNKAHKAAKKFDDKILLAGILPTLKKKDLVLENITPHKRYKVLNNILKKLRGNDFKMRIEGVDELIITHESILFEACNTSFQVHLQIPLAEMADKYNWAQAIAGPMLSVMSNSPMLLGKELWSETRIALFQQSMDLRNKSYLLREQKPRVSFGNDWIKKSIIELIQDDITRYTPLLTASNFKENALDVLKKGKIPKLEALNILNGTIYKWNRICYGQNGEVPHLRIENRYIPSGPSVKDEIANALFWVGVMQGMPNRFKKIYKKTPFKEVKGNFINAARTGINTYFNWFGKGISAKKLIKEKLLPMAFKGLESSNIDPSDIYYYLNIIERRIDTHQTGSIWIAKSNRKLREKVTTDIANAKLTSCMYMNQMDGKPIHQWELANFKVKIDMDWEHIKVDKFMTTEIFVVNENDLVELVAKIMEWKKIHHIPVVNNNNKIVGIITRTNLNEIDKCHNRLLVAKDIMIKNIIKVTSETSLADAKKIMLENKIGCLPVLECDNLIGILTKKDVDKLEQIPIRNGKR